MFDSASPSDRRLIPSYVRAKGVVHGRFERAGNVTRLVDRFETGGLRLRIPNAGGECDAVLLNTAGGMTGGDENRFAFSVGAEARIRITTQSAEKIYKADHAPAVVATDLTLEDGASLTWMPQETILFDGSGLSRTLNAEMPASASLLILEMTVLGRVARGERLTSGAFRDRRRIRRDGRLVFADDVRLAGDISSVMTKPVTGAGARAIATLLYVSPEAEGRLESLRAALSEAKADCGASAWNGLLVARFAARDPLDVRRAVVAALQRLSQTEMPKIWSI